MINRPIPTTEALIQQFYDAEAKRPKRTSQERFAEYVAKGFIDTKGRLTTLFSGVAEPEIVKADEILKEDWGEETPW